MIEKNERADRDRTASDISAELKVKMVDAVRLIVTEIREKLSQQEVLLVAIDGGTGAGKTTLALLLAAELPATIVQGDDFCQTEIDWTKMGAAEKAAHCIDWQRARREALGPLLLGKKAIWHPFNFPTGVGLADYFVVREPAPVIIIDGVYSSNPSLADILDLTILMDAPVQLRFARHNDREGHADIAWHELWDEAEEYYFTKIRPPSSFDIVIPSS
ncbi:MAG TPA: hypothetical protein VGJ00_03760 [Rhabdochlamydiaceae bacterium]|jgi:uridine kinase